MRSHGPNFVPWGTSAGTEDHSWWQSFASLIRCFRFIRKSMIQHTIWRGMSFVNNFCTKMLWFIRSKAFRKLNKTTRLVAPFPSVLTYNLCVMLIRAYVVLELGIGPNWCTSIFLRTAGLHSFLRHVFQQSWRLWVWVRLGVGSPFTSLIGRCFGTGMTSASIHTEGNRRCGGCNWEYHILDQPEDRHFLSGTIQGLRQGPALWLD